MSNDPLLQVEIHDLVDALYECNPPPETLERLESLLLTDDEACRCCLEYLSLHGALMLADGSEACQMTSIPEQAAVRDTEGDTPIPPIVLDVSGCDRYPSSESFVGGPVFSYLVATVVLCAMLVSAWTYRFSISGSQFVNSPLPSSGSDDAAPEFVGVITGMKNCCWAKDSLMAMVGASAPMGRKYALDAGLLEITYNSGAKVILEGPCVYEVNSTAGGYLGRGKLTARIEKRGVRSEERGVARAKPHAVNPQPPTPSPQPLAPLFAVTTPTAVVTDLGTEFGVEVSESGSTTSHVFRGSVKVQVVGNGSKKEVVLRANESVRVESDGSGRLHINQYTVAPGTFSRQIPRLVYIKVFNTGIGLKEGDRDPHWQLTARSDDPDFKPMQAVVASADISGGLSKYYLQNDSARSQWVSIAGDLPKVPCDATYTFSTTFELADLVPGSAVLRGWFLVDNHVTAIRLNGESQSVNDHGYTPPFNRFSSFVIRGGFVDGTNVLEIEVSNQSPDNTANAANRVALLVKLQGVAVCGGHVRAASAHAPRKDAGKEAQTKK